MATIKPIEGQSIHQIQSGQVIVDIVSVVKELVENALDAGATIIDVRFRNNGLDSIEVQDNGSGITPANYETVALKHHTSKLSSYSDLTSLLTYGFRGEALSSLCALSHFTITTCMAEDAPKGTKLEFETSGKLKGTSIVAAQKGTTVAVENIFQNLPVRRRELERKIKSTEWNRVIQHLGQYACIQTGVKISVSHQPAKGKKTTLFSTKGNGTTRENIVNVFGSKMLIGLLPLDLKLEMEPTSGPCQRWSTQEDGGTKDIRIVGHISKPGNGGSQGMKDKQMFYVNSRPCQLPQVKSVFNEVFKTFDPSNHPFVFANVQLDTHLYDVNVSPDKRTILLHDQARMLEHLKESLAGILDTGDRSMPISQMPAQKQPAYKHLTISRQETPAAETPRISRAPSTSSRTSSVEEEEDSEGAPQTIKRKVDSKESSAQKRFSPTYGSAVIPKSLFRKSLVEQAKEARDAKEGKKLPSLISNWLGRKTDDLDEKNETSEANTVKKVTKADGLSKEKRRLVEKFGRESDKSKEVVDDFTEYPSSPGGTPIPSYHPPRQVQDFNDRLAELVRENGSEQDVEQETNESEETQEPIPALSFQNKPSTPGILESASKSMRPPPSRTPVTEATISIGGRSITSSLGTPCPATKRKQIDSEANTISTPTKGPAPSFGSLLSQRFAAPGTTQASASSEEDNSQSIIADKLTTASRTDQEVNEEPSDEDVEGIEDTATGEGQAAPAGSSTRGNQEDDSDDEYIDDETKKAREEQKVQAMIQEAEEKAAQPTEDNKKRALSILQGGVRRKDSTIQLLRTIDTSAAKIRDQIRNLSEALSGHVVIKTETSEAMAADFTNAAAAEERLFLTVSKSDFASMKIIGQFNLGFILASHSSTKNVTGKDKSVVAEDMFIIDQHASDEKYNFERLQNITIVQSQRLVHPKLLDLTAIEEEIVMNNLPALEKNGFVVKVDESGLVGRRCQLVSLPISRETVFSIEDLEELIAILAGGNGGATIVPRPSKVRKMFAMRACRSSIMIGKTLTVAQMGRVVRHMGEIDKPWNCPHGRPTMRHLCELGSWDRMGWKEGDYVDGETGNFIRGSKTDWGGYVRDCKEKRAEVGSDMELAENGEAMEEYIEGGESFVDMGEYGELLAGMGEEL